MEFQWNDESVKTFVRTIFDRDNLNYLSHEIERFKKLKQPKPKDYEILSFVSPYGGINDVVFGKNHHGEFSPTGRFSDSTFSEFYMLSQPFAKIYSVRRLSDGEVFSVGDKMKEEDDVYVIDAFWKDYKGNDLWVSYNQRKKYGCSLDTAKKAKEVLFTTEDGVEIHEGCNYYHVCEDWSIANFHTCAEWIKYKNPPNKSFSTKEAAEDWILMNKPCLSVNDIIKQPCGYTIDLPNILKELAKSKI